MTTKVVRKDYSSREITTIAKEIQAYFKVSYTERYSNICNSILGNYPFKTADDVIKLIGKSFGISTHFKDVVELENYLSEKGLYCSDRENIAYIIRVGIPSIKRIKDDLYILMKSFDGFLCSDGDLYVNMGPFYLEDICFGKFKVAYPLRYFGNYCGKNPYAEALTPVFPKNQSNYTHPHISGNDLCVGGADKLLASAFAEYRIPDVFSIIESILNTYNADSPHAKIELWTGVECKECGEFYEEDSMGECSKCNRIYCCNCIITCCDYSVDICSKCRADTFRCYCCGEFLCSECVIKCEDCSELLCEGDRNKFHEC